MIGILAYGSLIADPGNEIRNALERRIEGVYTPFNVEYARKSRTRENAPTLVPVSNSIGAPVKGVILLLKEAITEEEAKNMLFRREIHKVGSTETYDDKAQTKKEDGLRIETLSDFHGIAVVIYTGLKPNFLKILDDCRPDEEKAKLLAQAAIESITPETYQNKKDGIWYLHQNIQSGIITPLTEPYKNEILRQANGATDLPTAREYFYRRRFRGP